MRKFMTNGLSRASLVSRTLLPVLIGVGCLWLLSQRMDAGSLSGIGPAIAALPVVHWLGALAATALSFWALGRYDVIFHRLFGTHIRARHAVLSGASAIAIAQVLGLGVVTGALVRWRILPGLSPAQATKIALAVALSFLTCLVALVGVMALVSPTPMVPASVAAITIFAFLICCLGSVLYPNLTVFQRQLSAPPLRAILSMMMLTALDTAAAATALYLLLPNGAALDWSMIYMAYLLALSAALFTGTPGGVGPFELALLACLPAVPEAELIAGILAFRIVYYACPALLALRFLAFPLKPQLAAPPALRSVSEVALQNAPRSELGVCRQNGALMLPAGGAQLAIVTTPQTVTALFDPLGAPNKAMLPALAHEARRKNRWPLVYKCSAESALIGRALGWSVLHIADEAVLNPAQFDMAGPSFRQLRRKLRQAEKAGVTVTRCTELPLHEMRRIDTEWQGENGGARGLTMGRFCPDYLQGHHIYIARQGADLIGFVSFHKTSRELCLDLMRTTRAAPNGTMHLMVQTAISEAAEAGYRRLSLAALPRTITTEPRPLHRLALRFTRPGNADGLTRFKSCFAPRLQPLYAMAPHGAILALGLADLVLAIRREDGNAAHEDHEENAFAPMPQT